MLTEDELRAASFEELQAEYKKMTRGDGELSNEERNKYISRINKYRTAAAKTRKKGKLGKGKWSAFKKAGDKPVDPKSKAKAAERIKEKPKTEKAKKKYVLSSEGLKQADDGTNKELTAAIKEREAEEPKAKGPGVATERAGMKEGTGKPVVKAKPKSDSKAHGALMKKQVGGSFVDWVKRSAKEDKERRKTLWKPGDDKKSKARSVAAARSRKAKKSAPKREAETGDGNVSWTQEQVDRFKRTGSARPMFPADKAILSPEELRERGYTTEPTEPSTSTPVLKPGQLAREFAAQEARKSSGKSRAKGPSRTPGKPKRGGSRGEVPDYGPSLRRDRDRRAAAREESNETGLRKKSRVRGGSFRDSNVGEDSIETPRSAPRMEPKRASGGLDFVERVAGQKAMRDKKKKKNKKAQEKAGDKLAAKAEKKAEKKEPESESEDTKKTPLKLRGLRSTYGGKSSSPPVSGSPADRKMMREKAAKGKRSRKKRRSPSTY
jgi:hypothetical protein